MPLEELIKTLPEEIFNAEGSDKEQPPCANKEKHATVSERDRIFFQGIQLSPFGLRSIIPSWLNVVVKSKFRGIMVMFVNMPVQAMLDL